MLAPRRADREHVDEACRARKVQLPGGASTSSRACLSSRRFSIDARGNPLIGTRTGLAAVRMYRQPWSLCLLVQERDAASVPPR